MICSVGLEGMRGYVVNIEADVRFDKEQCVIVGLPDTSIKESKGRILSNLHAQNFDLMLEKITIHLSPSDKRKIGVGYDCAMLLAVFNKMLGNPLPIDEKTCVLGSLSLNGDIVAFHGLIPSLQQALQLGFKRFLIPPIDTSFLQTSDDIEIVPLQNVTQMMDYLKGQLLDRIDFFLQLKNVGIRQEHVTESSATIRLRTTKARQVQYKRYGNPFLNGNAPSHFILEGCTLTATQKQHVNEVCYLQKYSNRTQLKLARTIADLQGDDQLQEMHLQEAISWKMEGAFHG